MLNLEKFLLYKRKEQMDYDLINLLYLTQSVIQYLEDEKDKISENGFSNTQDEIQERLKKVNDLLYQLSDYKIEDGESITTHVFDVPCIRR